MPFHDLNVSHDGNHAELSNTLSFLYELGYTTAALSVEILSKVPAQLPLVQTDRIQSPTGLQVLTRLNLTIADTSQNHRITNLVSNYDLLALRPVTEKAFQLCCSQLDCDIISLDFTTRIPYPIKFKTVASALQRGIRFEICYAGGITGSNDTRRNLISGAAGLIRATRGRGIIVSSEARNVLALRAPHDVINLASVWGLSNERAKEAVCEEVDLVLRMAHLKRSSFRGVIEVIEDGTTQITVDEPMNIDQDGDTVHVEASDNLPKETSRPTKPMLPLHKITVLPEKSDKNKRKASQASLVDSSIKQPKGEDGKTPSKREQKRQAKKARLNRALGTTSDSATTPSKAQQNSNSFSIRHETLPQK